MVDPVSFAMNPDHTEDYEPSEYGRPTVQNR